ncbi:sigma-70 family RNA polymerase sigma factor [Sciscionella marina]|uniref:sigma-70 family RNA polymerase sigma factor n=1 Tax=Sciscionella marina TaxID=508770 RepID=UPI0012F6477D|nr:sigma-70 family RNA polymerase sigma factor [Sciscionella marina]
MATKDTSAFAALYDQLVPRVYGLCRTILQDPRYAEDAAHAAFVDVWRTAPRYDPTRASPLTWVLTIAHRRAVDQVRTLRASAHREQHTSAANHTPQVDDVTDTVPTGVERQQIRDKLATLTPLQRTIITIIYYQGHTHAEAAAILNIPLGTLKTRVHSALCRLRTTHPHETGR